jgi:hypothetical protein
VLWTTVGRPDLLDPVAVHHHRAVGERHRLDLVMGHIDGGGAHLLMHALDLGFASARAAWRRDWTTESSNRKTFGLRERLGDIEDAGSWHHKCC